MTDKTKAEFTSLLTTLMSTIDVMLNEYPSRSVKKNVNIEGFRAAMNKIRAALSLLTEKIMYAFITNTHEYWLKDGKKCQSTALMGCLSYLAECLDEKVDLSDLYDTANPKLLEDIWKLLGEIIEVCLEHVALSRCPVYNEKKGKMVNSVMYVGGLKVSAIRKVWC